MLKDGISFRYVVLDTMEKFSCPPPVWDDIDKDTQLEMIAKRNKDLEHENYIQEKNRKEIENKKRNRRG